MTKDDIIKRLQEIGVIHKEKVTLRSGKTSDFYCDIKKAYGYPDILNALADEIGKLLPKDTTCIASSGYGGLPLGAVVASRFNKKFTAVRSAEKNHGKAGLINAYIPNAKDRVVIVDDVLTSGSSIRETLASIQEQSVETISAVVVIDRGSPKLPILYSYLFTIEEILGNSTNS